MNTILRAAVHLGKDYDMNLRFVKNSLEKQRDSFSGTLFGKNGDNPVESWKNKFNGIRTTNIPAN